MLFSPEQVQAYHRDGFTFLEGLLSPREVEDILDDVESICAGNTLADHDETRMEMEPNQPPDGTSVRRLYEPCSHYPRFRDLSQSEMLLNCLEQLLGPNILFHYSKLNMKPAEIGSVVEWHQDLSYYPLTNRDSLAVLFYLDDTDEENGFLRMIPGRHQDDLMPHAGDRFFEGRVTDAVNDSGAVGVGGRAGTAIFMHCMTPHASATNRSNRPRRTLILSYRAADAYPVYTGEMTSRTEASVRLVRGEPMPLARFTMTHFPIPLYKGGVTASLYELQGRSREGELG